MINKKFTIHLNALLAEQADAPGEFVFIGHPVPERESAGWTWYQTQEGALLKIRKSFIVAIKEENL